MKIRSILSRRLLALDRFDIAVKSYETLIGQVARLRFDYPDAGLRVAQIAQIIVIGGDENALKPFRDTEMTFLVNDLNAYVSYLPSIGAVIVRPIRTVPSGRNMLVQHQDGALVEYVEHDHPNPADDVI